MRPAPIPIETPSGWAAITYAKDQPEYIPLPVLRSPSARGEVISRWVPTWRERLRLLFGGSLWLVALTFKQEALQPVMLQVEPPEFDPPEPPERPLRHGGRVRFVQQCSIPPKGWYCARSWGHPGPCAAIRIGEETPLA